MAEEGDQLIGFAIASTNPTLQKAIIENLFVAPAFRGRGIGEELVKYVCQIVTESYGCTYVAALVPSDAEGALRTYRRQAGFTTGHAFVWLDKVFDDQFKR